ncbi:unnamed protein product, partial [Polarella glacialis]
SEEAVFGKSDAAVPGTEDGPGSAKRSLSADSEASDLAKRRRLDAEEGSPE